MKPILQPDRIAGETRIVSFRVPAATHEKLHQITEQARSMGMRINWQDLLRDHLDAYIGLADSELKKYGNLNARGPRSTDQSVSP